jgi:putative two-component system response regulator
MKVLTVDDDEVSLETLNFALQDAGYDVESAHNGREALEILRDPQRHCRLVITDWMMPEMDGLDLCRAVRAEPFRGYVYVIVLTCRDGMEETIEGLSAGADDFIAKPFDPRELTVRVRAGERILALETRDLTIFSMAKLAESRDPETGAHLDRVRCYCRVLVEGLSQRRKPGYAKDADYVQTIYLTSPLHDIGKLGVPDTVLLKPGRLSDREFEIMKTHTSVGADALGAALREFPDARFLRMARDIAATHHERFDGTGYPAGLVGDGIPLCGRIAALADVYDALTTKRVYKNAFGHEVSKSIIVQESGSHFDPEIVSAFLEAEDRFVDIAQRFAEPVPASV